MILRFPQSNEEDIQTTTYTANGERSVIERRRNGELLMRVTFDGEQVTSWFMKKDANFGIGFGTNSEPGLGKFQFRTANWGAGEGRVSAPWTQGEHRFRRGSPIRRGRHSDRKGDLRLRLGLLRQLDPAHRVRLGFDHRHTHSCSTSHSRDFVLLNRCHRKEGDRAMSAGQVGAVVFNPRYWFQF
jgi:hypothetical protein